MSNYFAEGIPSENAEKYFSTYFPCLRSDNHIVYTMRYLFRSPTDENKSVSVRFLSGTLEEHKRYLTAILAPVFELSVSVEYLNEVHMESYFSLNEATFKNLEV
uniref:Uncharacterized protein n=1 Tax=Dulem virus 176 TaxID=3145653 RepID=A0AAU8B776_9VIRU